MTQPKQSHPQLGSIISRNTPRDAIHIAIAPVICGDEYSMYRGEPVRIVDWDKDGTPIVKAARGENPKIDGIIDPWLFEGVEPGQVCYMLLNPYTITSLRHEWTHPEFDAAKERYEALNEQNDPIGLRAALRVIDSAARTCGKDFQHMMDIAEDYRVNGESHNNGDDESYNRVDWNEFWPAYEIVCRLRNPGMTEYKGPEYDGAPFSCAC